MKTLVLAIFLSLSFSTLASQEYRTVGVVEGKTAKLIFKILKSRVEADFPSRHVTMYRSDVECNWGRADGLTCYFGPEGNQGSLFFDTYRGLENANEVEKGIDKIAELLHLNEKGKITCIKSTPDGIYCELEKLKK